MQVGTADMFLTSNGGAIVNTDTSDSTMSAFVFGLGQKAITAVANLDGDYAGMLFDDSAASGSKVSPITMTCTSGTCSATLVTDIATGTTGAGSVTLTLSSPDSIAPGVVTGTVSDGGSGVLSCMADIDVLSSGKKIVSCVGQAPGDNTNMFNVIFVSKT